jgi:hypothetical protein
MAAINQIDLQVKTGNRTGGGTDGLVYFGIGGREFRIDQPNVNDLEPNMNQIFTFSATGNNANQSLNNPAAQYVMRTEDLSKFPKYVRFEPHGNDDNWNIETLKVVVNPGANQIEFNALNGSNHIWLGARNGKIVYIP